MVADHYKIPGHRIQIIIRKLIYRYILPGKKIARHATPPEYQSKFFSKRKSDNKDLKDQSSNQKLRFVLYSFLSTRWLKALEHTPFSPFTQGAGELFVTSTVAKFYSWYRESPSFTVYRRIWIWPSKRSCVREYEFIFCITAEENGADSTEDFLASQKLYSPLVSLWYLSRCYLSTIISLAVFRSFG